jgi:hypothetical protein
MRTVPVPPTVRVRQNGGIVRVELTSPANGGGNGDGSGGGLPPLGRCSPRLHYWAWETDRWPGRPSGSVTSEREGEGGRARGGSPEGPRGWRRVTGKGIRDAAVRVAAVEGSLEDTRPPGFSTLWPRARTLALSFSFSLFRSSISSWSSRTIPRSLCTVTEDCHNCFIFLFFSCCLSCSSSVFEAAIILFTTLYFSIFYLGGEMWNTQV